MQHEPRGKASRWRLAGRTAFVVAVWVAGVACLYLLVGAHSDGCRTDSWDGRPKECAVVVSSVLWIFATFALLVVNAMLVALPPWVWITAVALCAAVLPFEVILQERIQEGVASNLQQVQLEQQESQFGPCVYYPQDSYLVPSRKMCPVGGQFVFMAGTKTLHAYGPKQRGPVVCPFENQTTIFSRVLSFNDLADRLDKSMNLLSGLFDTVRRVLVNVEEERHTVSPRCHDALIDLFCDIVAPRCNTLCQPLLPCQSACLAYKRECGNIFTSKIMWLLPGGEFYNSLRISGISIEALTGLDSAFVNVLYHLLISSGCETVNKSEPDAWTCLGNSTEFNLTFAADPQSLPPRFRMVEDVQTQACTRYVSNASAFPENVPQLANLSTVNTGLSPVASRQCTAAEWSKALKPPPDPAEVAVERAGVIVFVVLVLLLPVLHAVDLYWHQRWKDHRFYDLTVWWQWTGPAVTAISLVCVGVAALALWLAIITRGNWLFSLAFALCAMWGVAVGVRYPFLFPQVIGAHVEQLVKVKAPSERSTCSDFCHYPWLAIRTAVQLWRSTFSLEQGRWFLIRMYVLEMVEMGTQFANALDLATTRDSWDVLVLVALVSLNLVGSPLISLTKNVNFQTVGGLAFDTLMDVSYMTYSVVVLNTDNQLDTLFFLALCMPMLLIVNRMRGLSNTLSKRRGKALSPHVRVRWASQAHHIDALPRQLHGRDVESIELELRSDAQDEENSDDTVPSQSANGAGTFSSPKLVHRPSISEALGASDGSLVGATAHLSQRGRVVHRAMVAVLVSLGLALFTWCASSVVLQDARCRDEVGIVLWARTSPRVFFENGLLHSPSCSWGQVTEMSLEQRGIPALPSTIATYTALNTLVLSNNVITELPISLRECTRLSVLNVSHNHLSGVPDALSDLTSLRTVDLSFNAGLRYMSPALLNAWGHHVTALSLSGTEFSRVVPYANQNISFIPPLLIRSTASSVEHLDLSFNRLSAMPPSLEADGTSPFQALRVLKLGHNRLSVLPPRWQLQHVTYVDLSHNQVHDLCDECMLFTSWNNLMYFNISYNGLRNITVSLNDLSENAVVDVRGSNIETIEWQRNKGRLHSFVAQLPVRSFVCSPCLLTSVPAVLGQLTNLESLNLQKNDLTSIDNAMHISSLKFLWLFSNELHSLPQNWSSLVHLETLEISNNPITVEGFSLGRDLTNLPNLRTLHFQRAKSLAHIPSWIGQFANTSLRELDFYFNYVHPLGFPSELGLLTTLEELDLRPCRDPGCPSANMTLSDLPFELQWLHNASNVDVLF